MERLIEEELQAWVRSAHRKVLVLRGARQVGKTWSVRRCGASFERFVELNFEEDPALSTFFEGPLDPGYLCERLAAYKGTEIEAGKTLLFFDEIQACPKALHALRFFHEQMPELHVAAAGSLLEFALQEIPSLGVGRLEFRHMYPLSMRELAVACGQGKALDLVCRERACGPNDPLHRQLIDLTRVYLMIGGFPEVVQHYVSTRDLTGCMAILDDLLTTLRGDFAKYRRRVPASRLDTVLRSVAAQAGGKFVCSRVPGELRAEQVRRAEELLVLAGLVHRIRHTSAHGLPLGAQANERKYKLIPCDVGLHQRLCGLRLADQLTKDDRSLVSSGSAAELLAGTELLVAAPARTRAELFYWHRESRNSNAEVDYVVQAGPHVVPVEVKAGTRGAMRSMRMFLASHDASPYGLRASLEPFAECADTKVIPLYALAETVRG